MAHYISFKGKEIKFRSEGVGKPIVLLHGFLESGSIWNDFSKQLSKQFRVIVIDLPGHGGSEVVEEVHTMELMADIVKAVLDHCGIGSCLMVGHSMGGYVMLAFARKYEHTLKGICLFNSNALADTPDAKVNRSRAIAVVKQNHQGFISNFIPDLFAPENVEKFKNEIIILREEAMKMTQQAIIASLDGMKARSAHLDFLSKTSLPVLFIIGKKDSRSDFSKMLEHISLPTHSESLILGDCGHMGWIEAAETTLGVLGAFASRVFN
jgi:pimeloyl-ACP methyl ester carboxylesterase